MKTWFETEKINILNATLETKEKLTVVKSNLNMIQRIIFWCIKTVMHVDLYYDYASWCLVYEILYIRTIRPNLNTQSDYIRAKLFV